MIMMSFPTRRLCLLEIGWFSQPLVDDDADDDAFDDGSQWVVSSGVKRRLVGLHGGNGDGCFDIGIGGVFCIDNDVDYVLNRSVE